MGRFRPSYLNALEDGRLGRAERSAWERMKSCDICPHACGVNRALDESGFCQAGRLVPFGGAMPHFGEEAPLVGRGGSGTIFFGGCNLLCRFCQNWETSRCEGCQELSPAELSHVMLSLQAMGCENINLVTPTHVVAPFLSALKIAARQGLALPIVYNTGGYDSVETLELLDGIVDIYMPDLKTASPEWAEKILNASDYWEVARAAALEMHRQVGDLTIGPDGIATRGLLVRHLVMPGEVARTPDIIEFIARELSTDTYVNLMDQYRPVGEAHSMPPIDRRVTRDEYLLALESAKKAGLTRFRR